MHRRPLSLLFVAATLAAMSACDKRFDDAKAIPKALADVQRTYPKNGAPWQLRVHQPFDYRGVAVNHGLELYPDGRLRSAQLVEDQRFDGVLCGAKTMVSFYPHGRLRSAFLAKAASVQGKAMATRAFLRFDRKGKLVGAIPPKKRHGVLYGPDGEALACDGGRVVLFAAKDGWGCTLAKEQRISGLWAKAGGTVFFDADGRLRLLVLSRPQTVEGKAYPAGAVVELAQKRR